MLAAPHLPVEGVPADRLQSPTRISTNCHRNNAWIQGLVFIQPPHILTRHTNIKHMNQNEA